VIGVYRGLLAGGVVLGVDFFAPRARKLCSWMVSVANRCGVDTRNSTSALVKQLSSDHNVRASNSGNVGVRHKRTTFGS
jgi:hypothetical protein